MKILIIGDSHFRLKRPEKRLDEDFFDTQLNKLKQVVKIYREKKCNIILQVGDFFDSPKASNFVMSSIIKLLKREKLKIYCIYGQHDITSHAAETLNRSPLKVLEAADVIKILDSEAVRNYDTGISIFGASFGQSVDDIIRKYTFDTEFNILVIHKMIGNVPLFPGHELTMPKSFLRKYADFDLICCGDYHYSFCEKLGNRTILNPGCLVRLNVGKHDLALKPGIVIFDTETNETKRVLLKVQPVEKIFDLSKEKKKDDEKLLRFIEELKGKQNTPGIRWRDILQQVLEEKKSSGRICNLMQEIIGEAI